MEIAGQIFPEIQCPCRAGACIVKTSWTERNPGRKFYSCPGDGMQGRRCNFFKWCDIASPLKRVESGTEPMDIDGQSSPEMQCTCGLGACIVQISWTEKNPGRKFYCCPGIQGRRCGFFMWCDIGSPVKRIMQGIVIISGLRKPKPENEKGEEEDEISQDVGEKAVR